MAESVDDRGDGDPQAEWAQEYTRKQTEKLCRRVKERKTLSTQACCRCNGNGTCSRCECAKARWLCSSVCLPCKKNRCQNQQTTTNTTATLNDTPAPGPGVSNPMESHPRGPSATEVHSVNRSAFGEHWWTTDRHSEACHRLFSGGGRYLDFSIEQPAS